MKFQIQTTSRTPLYEQLAEQIRRGVATGKLRANERLPSVRQLSRELLINPNTVARTYQELEREGMLSTRPGLGVFVAQPRSELTEAARRRRLIEPLDQWLITAVHLGYSAEEALQLAHERAQHFQWNATTETAP